MTTDPWAAARARLDGLPGGRGLNIAHEAVDRHVLHDRGDHVALRWLRRDGTVTEATYRQLQATSNRFAGALSSLGVDAGERVFTLTGRIPELYATALGTWKHRCVLAPLFCAFGPEPVCVRLRAGDARVLVTTPALYERRIRPIRDRLPSLAHVLLVGAEDELPAGTASFERSMELAAPTYDIPATDPEDVALLHFTSGTTGPPKGAVHVHEAVVVHHETGRTVLDLHPDDVFWCTADPGWITGTSYGIVAPLSNGVTTVVDEGDLDAERWYRVLQDQRVTVWYTAPTALRMLRRAGTDLARGFDLSHLRHVASVGEPLDADTVEWTRRAFGVPAHDTWWQTETGGIVVANPAGSPVHPGSMGRPLPGIEVAVLARGADGRAAVEDAAVREAAAGEAGELAMRPGWPSMFRGYLHEPERYARCFAGGWYLTGDVVRRDADGWLWFEGRADDIITSAGHRIGPVEVERLLMEHPAVVEAGVVGLPDAVASEVVAAFVALCPDIDPTEDLRLDLLAFARRRLGPAVAPRTIRFVAQLPHTRSGKILRRLLRARELGLPEGDLSMLEDP